MDKTAKKFLIFISILLSIALLAAGFTIYFSRDIFKPITQDASNILIQTANNIPAAQTETAYIVSKVIDGDTIQVEKGIEIEKVRLIGIDSPELKGSECYATQARSALKELIEDKYVELKADSTQDNKDRYSRLLRYIYLDNLDINKYMLEKGFAKEYTYKVPYQNQFEYKQAQKFAQMGNAGMWGECNEI